MCVHRLSTTLWALNVLSVIVKASSGPRYVVSYRPALPANKLKTGTRVSLDMTTLTIMRILPREVDPMVYKMSLEDPGGVSFAGIGGLGEQVRELREVRPRYVLLTRILTSGGTLADHRAAASQPRALPARRHQAPQRCTALWAARNRKDAASACRRRNARDQLPQGRFVRHRRQVHRRVCTRGARDVRLCARARALRHLHGRNRCHRRETLFRGH